MKVKFNIHTNIGGREFHPGDVDEITEKQFKQYTMSGGKKRKGLPHIQKVYKNGKIKDG